MTSYDVIVIGGGPAGLMAAGQAALAGKKVLLIEKMENPGIKLLLTGKGRCNISNTAPIEQALEHFNISGKFLTQAFYRFYNQELCSFFEDHGLKTIVERGGRIFPATESARDVLNVLLDWTAGLGVDTRTETSANKICLLFYNPCFFIYNYQGKHQKVLGRHKVKILPSF